MKVSSLLVLFCAILYTCEGYKILAIFPISARSHYNINYSIVKELVKRGHEVTHVTPYPQKTTPKNLKEISVESIIDVMNEHKKQLANFDKTTIFEYLQFINHMGYIITEAALKHENVQKLLQARENYDAIILPISLTDGLLGIADHVKAPMVLVATMPLYPWSSFFLNHPSLPSFVPHLLASYTGRMNFWERFMNSFHHFYTLLYHQWVVLPKHRELVKKYVPGEPDLYDSLNNGSLVLINSHMSTYEAMPLVPNAVEIGGAHIEEPKALPADIQEFLDSSKDGVVVFALGSNLKSSTLPQATIDEIFKAFSKLKQNVLCKWEKDELLPNQPKNVKLSRWLPVSDVLAHPNIKAFINHGGLLSIMEGIYYGIPILGIPFFGDQKMNMAIASLDEYAVTVHVSELNEETLSEALNKILNDPKYRKNAIFRSNMMRDRPQKPIDTAMYWIDYVIRHKGAPHLRFPGSDLAWYQLYLLDVIGFALVIIIFTVSVICMILKRIFKPKTAINRKKKKSD